MNIRTQIGAEVLKHAGELQRLAETLAENGLISEAHRLSDAIRAVSREGMNLEQKAREIEFEKRSR